MEMQCDSPPPAPPCSEGQVGDQVLHFTKAHTLSAFVSLQAHLINESSHSCHGCSESCIDHSRYRRPWGANCAVFGTRLPCCGWRKGLRQLKWTLNNLSRPSTTRTTKTEQRHCWESCMGFHEPHHPLNPHASKLYRRTLAIRMQSKAWCETPSVSLASLTSSSAMLGGLVSLRD